MFIERREKVCTLNMSSEEPMVVAIWGGCRVRVVRFDVICRLDSVYRGERSSFHDYVYRHWSMSKVKGQRSERKKSEL
jgi:hypothetical protein